jgi:hypothetical protein
MADRTTNQSPCVVRSCVVEDPRPKSGSPVALSAIRGECFGPSPDFGCVYDNKSVKHEMREKVKKEVEGMWI